MQKRVERTYGFLTCLKHAGIYVELLDALKLHFTIEDYLTEASLNKQIFEELAELLCSEKTTPSPLYTFNYRFTVRFGGAAAEVFCVVAGLF